VGGHGHASFGTVARQLDAVLQQLPADALVLLAPDAGGVSNASVLEQLLRTAGRVVLQGRQPLVAWWGQSAKPAKEEGTSRPNLAMGDPDEVLIDWPDGGQPHARYWLVVSEELHQLGLAWHGAALAHGMGSEEEMAARELMLGPLPSRPSDGDTLEDLEIRQALRAAVKERSGLIELLCGGGVHLDSPQLELRHRELRTEQVIDRDGDPAWRWSVPGRAVELLGIEEWIERCVPETICRLRTGEDPDLEGSYEEWPARAELLQQWREGQALRAAGGGRIPPLPPRWGKATTYGPDGRDEAWREALMGLRQGQEQVLAAALRRWAAADGLTPEELTAATEVVLSEPEWLRPGERRDALVERAALTEALRRHYSQQPYAERGRQALLIADPTGSGKSHRWAQIATGLAKEQGLIGVLWLAKDYRSAVVEPLREATRALPPTRHNGLFRNTEGKVRERGPDEKDPPAGWSWAESPTCQMSHDLARQRARGHSNAAIDDWCNNVCHLRGGCPYHQTKEHFWAMRGSESGRMPLIGKSENVGGRWIKPRPDFVRASMAMVQPFEALAYGWLKRVLVVVDEADHLLASCTATHKLKGHHLAALQLQLARSALERKQAGDAEAAAQLESVAELLVVLVELCSSKAIGRHGLSPRQLQEHPLMEGWLKGAEAAGLPAVLMQAEEINWQKLSTTAPITLDPLGLRALNKALDQEGLQAGMASPEADLCPPLLLELIRGALGDAVHRGSTVLSLEAVRQPKGTKAAANAPRFAVAITRPTGVGHTLASTAGALVVLDATSAPELIERALNATAGRTDHRSTPIGLRTLQLQPTEPTNAHWADPMEQHPPVQILQVRDLGGLTRDRRDTFAAIREALLIEISDWIKATYGEGEELGVIDHLKFCRSAEQGPLAKGIRQEQAWFTTGARGGNLLAGVRGLALLGLPVTNITASTSQALALADWSDPSAQPDELGVAIAEGQARSIGSELMQAIGRPRWNRQPKGWGPAALVIVGDGDLSALLPAIPGQQPSDPTNAHWSGIREIGAEWFGEQLGRGAEGLVARARAQRKGKTTEARVAGKAKASSKTTEQAAAIREQIRDAVVEELSEAINGGMPAGVAVRVLSVRALANKLGLTALTVRKHLLAMASAVDPALKARGAAVMAEECVEAVFRYEAKRSRPKAA
jgi:hypothetical protein